ncbi:glutathione transferase [Aureococcus anophagefferens]|nr:glutathione transferase [Aureococcus anophagefferens]
MPKLKLTYFDIQGPAEPARLALTIGNVPFEDKRVSGDEMRAMRAAGELKGGGQVPQLEVDGEVLSQSQAITQFCGRLAGLYPSDPWTAAKVEEVIMIVNQDIRDRCIAPTMREQDPEKKAAMRKELSDAKLPEKFAFLEALVQPSGYMVGDSLTIADLHVYVLMNWIGMKVLDGVDRSACSTRPSSEPLLLEPRGVLAETVSLIGGLLVLRGYLDKERSGARCRLAGRLLLPSLYAYHAASALSKNLRDEYHAAEHTWAMYAYDACLVAGLVAAVLAVCLGLRSRIVALALALLNLGVVFVEHPFWAYRGVTRRSQLPQAYWNSPIIGEIGAGVAPDQYCDLHQYFFFQGVSTTGALLLLAYHGPGDHAVQSDENVVERLLPAVNRNKD